MEITNFEELIEVSSSYISKWTDISNEKKYDEAKESAAEFLTICKKNLLNYSTKHDSKTLTYFRVLGALFRGFQKFNEVDKLTYSADWINNTSEVEKVWRALWDCKDR